MTTKLIMHLHECHECGKTISYAADVERMEDGDVIFRHIHCNEARIALSKDDMPEDMPGDVVEFNMHGMRITIGSDSSNWGKKWKLVAPDAPGCWCNACAMKREDILFYPYPKKEGKGMPQGIWRNAGIDYEQLFVEELQAVEGFVQRHADVPMQHYPWFWEARTTLDARLRGMKPIQGYAPTLGDAKKIVEMLLHFTGTLPIEQKLEGEIENGLDVVDELKAMSQWFWAGELRRNAIAKRAYLEIENLRRQLSPTGTLSVEVEVVGYEDLPEDEQGQQPSNGGGELYANYLKVTFPGKAPIYYSDVMEPEDARFTRDLSWIGDALIEAYNAGAGVK
jgi:hypothetical protein